MKIVEFQNRQFNKGLRGYETQEVDIYINDLLIYCNSLSSQINELEKKLSSYEAQEQYLKSTLLTAEKTAASIIDNAKTAAKNIQNQVEKKAIELIVNTENETSAYRNNVYSCYYSYEQELRRVIDRFSYMAKKHMENLENELINEIKTTVCNFDSEFNLIPSLRQGAKNINSNEKQL